jgi:hypothetical protein
LVDASGGGVNPLEFLGVGELIGAERCADENVGVGDFIVEAVVVGEMDDAHLGPAFADGGGHHLVGAPLWEGVPDADDELGVSGFGAGDGQRSLRSALADELWKASD